jgi:hypothetical protein
MKRQVLQLEDMVLVSQGHVVALLLEADLK